MMIIANINTKIAQASETMSVPGTTIFNITIKSNIEMKSNINMKNRKATTSDGMSIAGTEAALFPPQHSLIVCPATFREISLDYDGDEDEDDVEHISIPSLCVVPLHLQKNIFKV